jgi:hypothetical protein
MALVRRTNRNQNNQLMGDAFTNVPSNTVFSLGDFRVESNFTGRKTKDYSNELSSFVKPITLESLLLNQTQSERFNLLSTNATLNLDKTDLRSYAKFGSAHEAMRVGIQNIVLKYPASLFVSNQINIGGNVTVVNYLFDADTNTSTFNIPATYVVNKFGLTFNDGNNEVINDNELRNLNVSYFNYVIWRKDKPTENGYDILSFLGDSATKPFITLLVKGNPFPEAISGTTTNIPYHLKPNPEQFNLFKSRLNTLESYLIKERISGQTGFITTLKNIIDYDTGVQFIDKNYIWPTTDGYNVDFDNALFNAYESALLNLGVAYDTLKTDLIFRFLTPESIKIFDNTDEQKMSKLLRIYGREIDDTRLFIDSLVNINKVSYDKKKNIPDQLVGNLARALGWDFFALLEEEQFMDEITALNDIEKEENDLLPAEIDIELWRRILINTNYYWKSKGTRHALKSILLLIGIPEPFVNITEYVYTVDGKINPDEVVLTLADLPSASLPYNSQGYPIAVAETNDMFFQLSGNSDSGQAYIDLYRAVGFDVNRTIDNKKSWIETGYAERTHYTTPNYFQNDSQLIINTKEIDVTLDTARAIEYDVWRYITQVDFPINSSGYTKPYTFVNVGIGYDAPATKFTIPHTPLGSIQFNFNGLVLSPSGSTEISSGTTSWDYSQSGNTVEINPASGVYAQQYPSGEKDVITLTYLYDRLGIPTVGEIKYLVYRINPSSEITNAGARVHLPEEPQGDVQLSVNGISVAKGGASYVGDYIQDPNDHSVLVIQNSDLILYLQTNPIVVVSFIVNTTDISIEKKSEFYRVDGYNTSKLYYCAPINKIIYKLNFAVNSVEDVKFMVNGITLQPYTDYQVNPSNPYEIYLPPSVHLGDVLGVFYIIDPSNSSTPIIPDSFGLGNISNLTFLEFIELIQRKLVNAKSRKIITDFNGGYYPTLEWLYTEYLRRSCLPDSNPLKTNGYTFANLYPFISKYNAFFERFIRQLLPATIILRKGGILIRNTIFTKQKFTYKRGVSFDPDLNWFGDNGSEFKYKLPNIVANWDDDFVCEDTGTTTTTTSTTTSTTTTVPPTTTTTTTLAPTTTTTTTTEPVVNLTWVASGGSSGGTGGDSPNKTTYWNLELSQPLTPGQTISVVINYQLSNTADSAIQQITYIAASSGVTSGSILITTGNLYNNQSLANTGTTTGNFLYQLNHDDTVASQQLRIALGVSIDGDGSTSGLATAQITNTSIFNDVGVTGNIVNPTAPIAQVESNPTP